MKKSFFILLIVVFLGSCNSEFDNVAYTITNDSSKEITFTFNDIPSSLVNGESITYTINSEQNRFYIKDITFQGHQRSITLTTINKGTAGIFYTFSDNIPLILNVVNKLPISITIKADDFIAASADPVIEEEDDEDIDDENDEVIDDTGDIDIDDDDQDDEEQFILTTLTIEGNNSKTAFIYTSNPNFTIISPDTLYHDITIDWELIDDTTINVIIK